MTHPDNFDDDRYEEERPRRRRRISCHDRMCGATDCELCHPEGRPREDDDDEETEEEKE